MNDSYVLECLNSVLLFWRVLSFLKVNLAELSGKLSFLLWQQHKYQFISFSLSWAVWRLPMSGSEVSQKFYPNLYPEFGSSHRDSPFCDFLSHFPVALVALNSSLCFFNPEKLHVFYQYFGHPVPGSLGLFPSANSLVFP